MEKTPKEFAKEAREASLRLRVLPSMERVRLLEAIADSIETHRKEIMAKNAIDVQNATGNISESLLKRLELKEKKLDSAIAGIRQIARSEEPIGKRLSKIEIMKGLALEKTTVPIGVLLIIFEARPEALLQITALAIRSGNGLLLKGGKEAAESNAYLTKLIHDAIENVLPNVSSGLIHLVQTREEIADLLQLDDVIDLVIPRGSNQLVTYIQQNTKIPVLGHSDGICHVYVDEFADIEMACKICVDSKIDYPAACNAVETILLHASLLETGGFQTITNSLKSNGVHLYKGEHSALENLPFDKAPSLNHEYSSMDVTIEIVDDLNAAIDHIHKYGSAHTDVIVTENVQRGHEFLNRVDSACVFHNTSSRWSDGFRFGLGAEVGISTSRIHARGPVGVEGLMTTKFVLCGKGHLVDGDVNKAAYRFKACALEPWWQTKSAYLATGVLVGMVCGICFQVAHRSFDR